jgi:protein-L-isoaspartate(D-aspartate) O-methyltransferase
MSHAAARLNMLDAQVRANDVTDPRIQAAMGAIARERFVPSTRTALAYADVPVPIAPQRYLLDPRSFAKLLQLARIEPEDQVLDVACGTGYSSVVIARLAKSVVALEQDADLVRLASDLVPAAGASNALVTQGSLIEGFKAKAPYNVIFINGAIETRPDTLLAQLAEGGRLVTFMKTADHARAHIFTREQDHVGQRADFDAMVPLLTGFRKSVGFVF